MIETCLALLSKVAVISSGVPLVGGPQNHARASAGGMILLLSVYLLARGRGPVARVETPIAWA